MRSLKTAGIMSTLALATLFFSPSGLSAEEPTNIRPQMGIFFGPVTPMPFTDIDDRVDTFLGGGMFFRINWPFTLFRSEVGLSWNYYASNDTSGLFTMPIYGAGVYRLPLSLPLKFQVKAGGGSAYVSVDPEDRSRWDPLMMLGFEASFPAGRRVNIGLRLDYYLIFESHLDVPPNAPSGYENSNYQFLNVGLMVNYYFAR